MWISCIVEYIQLYIQCVFCHYILIKCKNRKHLSKMWWKNCSIGCTKCATMWTIYSSINETKTYIAWNRNKKINKNWIWHWKRHTQTHKKKSINKWDISIRCGLDTYLLSLFFFSHSFIHWICWFPFFFFFAFHLFPRSFTIHHSIGFVFVSILSTRNVLLATEEIKKMVHITCEHWNRLKAFIATMEIEEKKSYIELNTNKPNLCGCMH